MAILTDPELASMRATANRSLNGTAVIQTSAWQSDGGGGGTTGWTNAGTFSCRLAPYTHSSGEIIEADRLSPDSEVLFTFPAGTDVENDNQIVFDGDAFSVTAVRQRSAELTHRVEAKRIT